MSRHEHQGKWWEPHFPWGQYPSPLPNQEDAFYILGKNKGTVILELPPGSGKTAIGYTFLKEGLANGEGPLFYISPNKVLVNQVKELHPGVRVVYGRHEYDCLYYPPEPEYLKADEIPCLLLTDCPHRVDQETGETEEPGAERCPYYDGKWRAKKEGVIVDCTMSFFLFTQFFSREFMPPARLVIDEAHRIADVVRNSLSYDITDYHLWRGVELFKRIGATEDAERLRAFTRRMIRIIKRHGSGRETLLEDDELVELLELLLPVAAKRSALRAALVQAIRSGVIDKHKENETLTKIDRFVFQLNRYITALNLSLSDERRNALNYTCAYWVEEVPEEKRVQYKLVIKAYYVAPIIRKLLGERTLAMSATIGDPDKFGFETGIQGSFHSLKSHFPAKNTRIFLPTNVADLSYNNRSHNEPNRTLRRIVRASKLFAGENLRSLVVLISEAERRKFLMFSEEEALNVISYGNGIPARRAAEQFKNGEGDVLVGTAAHYSEGIDLPKRIAPVIFFLRPGNPRPDDPLALFEERRFSLSRIRGIRQYRIMNQAQQVRGRNLRGEHELGVCFFMSAQFGKFLYASLPGYLRVAYVHDKSFDECVEDTLKLLKER